MSKAWAVMFCCTLANCSPNPPPKPLPVTSVEVPLPPIEEEHKPAPKVAAPKDIPSKTKAIQHSVDKAWTSTVHYQMQLKKKLLKPDVD